jgi:prepilin-type N-terminal cleavage/methylation domain-containing protein
LRSKQFSNFQKHRGFTLIELLVVITIIAILAGASFPVINGVMTKAKKVKALAVVKDIQVAVKSYQTEYNRYPAPAAGGGDTTVTTADTNFIAVLLGQTGGGTVSNPRQIKFLELPPAKNGKGGLIGTIGAQTLVDDWGVPGARAGNPYTVIMDSNYDNQITIPGITTGPLPLGTAIYCNGPDGIEFSRDDITSWGS